MLLLSLPIQLPCFSSPQIRPTSFHHIKCNQDRHQQATRQKDRLQSQTINEIVMFMQSTARVRSLYSRVPTKDLLEVNQGALYICGSRAMATSDVGSGAGKGGGGGGSIREAGGAMGRKGAAQEEQYFNKQSKALKDKLKDHLKDEIKKHEDAIKASKEIIKEMDKEK